VSVGSVLLGDRYFVGLVMSNIASLFVTCMGSDFSSPIFNADCRMPNYGNYCMSDSSAK